MPHKNPLNGPFKALPNHPIWHGAWRGAVHTLRFLPTAPFERPRGHSAPAAEPERAQGQPPSSFRTWSLESGYARFGMKTSSRLLRRVSAQNNFQVG